MPSWGIELELPGVLKGLHIHSVVVQLRLPGEADVRYYKPNTPPMRIGPSCTEEFRNLKSLSRKIARFLNERDIPKNISVQNVNFEKAVVDFINTQKREFFNLYKCETELKKPSFLPAVDIYESRIRRHFIFSADHFDEFVIPELITEPFALGQFGFNQKELNDEDAIAFLQKTYLYATALCQNLPLVRNVEVYLPILRVIGALFDIVPNSLHVTAIGTMHLTQNPNEPLYISPQLNTIVDLTHFSSRPRAGSPDPLQDLLRLSNRDTFNWLPPALGQNRLIDYEVAILNFTRNVVNNMDMRLEQRAPHESDPWIRGAVGLGIWSVLSLCVGGSETHGSIEKNLWLLMPKINPIDFLTGAFEACESLGPSLYNYYYQLTMNFIPAFEAEYALLPQHDVLKRALSNDVIIDEKNLIQNRLTQWWKRLMRWRGETSLPVYWPNLVPKDFKTIERLIIATFVCATPERSWPRYGRGLFVLDTDLLNACKFMKETLAACTRLNINDRGGYGRPKFELRSVPGVTIPAQGLPVEPNFKSYIDIFNRVARPAVGIPLPPDVPVEHLRRFFPAESVDSACSETLYGGQENPRQQFHSVWFPGIPGYEHGARAPDRVRKWIAEQDAIQAKEHSNTSFFMLANIQIELEQMRTLRAQQNLLIDELKAINAKVVERHWFGKKSILVTMPTELKISTAQISRQIENFNERIQKLLSDGREAHHKALAAADSSQIYTRNPAGRVAVSGQPDRNATIIAAAAAKTAEENSKRIYDQMLILSTESWEIDKQSKAITARVHRAIV